MLPSHRKAFETLFKTYGYIGMLDLIARKASELGCDNTATTIISCRNKIAFNSALEDAK